MTRNPEFLRNAWTELTGKRLAAMPLLLLTLYFLGRTVGVEPWRLGQLYFGLFCLFTFVWGTRQAAESVVGEINARTWQTQVMTSLSPWQMATGKLLGSTAYVWYGNALCLALAAWTVMGVPHPPEQDMRLAATLGSLALFGLAAHILPLLVSLHSIRWRHTFERFDLTFFQLLGLLVIIPAFWTLRNAGAHIWYGRLYTDLQLGTLFVAIFIAWGLFSLVSQFKTEFGQEPYPLPWLLFALTIAAVLIGFNAPDSPVPFLRRGGEIMAFFALLLLSYLTVCGESSLSLRPHMLAKYWRARQWGRLAVILPRSLVLFPAALGVAWALTVQLGDSEAAVATGALLWALALFMLRDFCIVYLWGLAAQGTDRQTTVVPVLGTLATYTLVPAALYHLGGRMFLPVFMPYFYSTPGLTIGQSSAIALAPPAVEAAVAVVLLARRVRAKMKELSDV